MKHPALTRIFAVVLAVFCLVMLLAGLGSGAGTLSDRKKGQEDLRRLTDRLTEYEETLAGLAEGEDYAKLNSALKERQEAHETVAGKHRSELAIYTATRSGVRQGIAAMQTAAGALAIGKAQYEEGLKLFEEQAAAFEEGYQQFQEGKEQLRQGQKTMNLVGTALSGLRAQLEQLKTIGAVLQSDNEEARRELSIASFDSLLTFLDQSTLLFQTLKEQGGIQPEQIQQLVEMLSEQSELDEELKARLLEIQWQGVTEESLQELEDRVTEATGFTVEEIRDSIQTQRDTIADADREAPLSEEQFAMLQAAYAQSRAWTEQIGMALEAKLSEWEGQFAEAKAQLDAAQAQIDELDEVMELGKEGIEQGREALEQAGEQIKQGEQALNNGRWQLRKQEEELNEKAEVLRQEKEKLDQEAEELQQELDRAENRKMLEQRETSLRLMLLDREEIQSRYQNGMSVSEAARDYTESLAQKSDSDYRGRLRVCILMLAGAAAGILGIPAAFEKTKSRFWLIAPVLGCLGCAAGAELLCRMLGRGNSYSALAAAGFALIQLLLVIPKKKA